jgi:type II secretory pathway pseudopilin PulG
MNAPTLRNSMLSRMSKQYGTTLLEVLMAIVIFAGGMMALASLQGNLTRSSSDSNMRTVAANIAEETIEGQRAFEGITSAPGIKAYDDIVDQSFTKSAGNVDYTVDVDVTDYYFRDDWQSVSPNIADAPAGTTDSSFKYAELTVTWNPGIEFQIDDTQSTSDGLGSGSITIASVIPSIPPLNNARVAAEDDGALGYPPVNYTPGLNPDIVAISLGNQKFKESTTPEPVVRRRDELMETWFDVITYTSNGTDPTTFLRREEFASISCECTLQASDPAVNVKGDGREPTLWTGAEYAEGEFVAKPFGVSANNQQSQFCDVCCRDHHDTAGTHNNDKASYRPNASSFTGDHPHYGFSNQGVLQLAEVGDDYLEACRLVRKDGFFRVAQDFDLQNQIAFPENFLDQPTEVDDYSTYVTGAVEDHFSGSPSANRWVHSLNFDGNCDPKDGNCQSPPTLLDETDRQYRSRGVYTDVINAALDANLTNCFDNQGVRNQVGPPDCTITDANQPIEVLPFFDVQVTQLARWRETEQADPIDVSNEEISNNGYSRGLATLAGSKDGDSIEHSTIEKGNVGLISITPIREGGDTEENYSEANLFAVAGDGGAVAPGITVSGTISNAKQTGNAVPSVTGAGANCTRPDNTTFVCVLDAVSVDAPTITISNYYKLNTNLIACTADLTYVSHVNGTSLESNRTVYLLPPGGAVNVVITIVLGTSCP